MKKLLVLALTLALLFVMVTPAAAAGGGPGGGNGNGGGNGKGNGRGTFALVGTIASLDAANHTVTITILRGNKLAQPFIGQNITFQTSTSTRFLVSNTNGTCMTITFADLAVGQDVSANGTLASNAWTAKRIAVGARLVDQP